MASAIEVEDVYDVSGIGLVVATMGDRELEKLGFEYGEYAVELRRPDGTHEVA